MKDKDRPRTRVLNVENYRGEVTPEFDDPLFLEAVARPGDLWSRPGTEILLEQRNKVGVVRIPMSSGPPKDVVIKEFAPRGLVRIKSFIQPSKALRAWRGALALKDRGLETAPPAAYLEERRGGLAGRSFFFAERVTGAEEIRSFFRRLTPYELEPLLSALGGHLSLCHDRGILHRDLSDGNILVKKNESGRFIFYLLDTNRIRLRKKLGSFRRAKNLIRLGVPAAFQKKFLLQDSGVRPFRRRHWFWYKWNKSVFTAYIGLKRKLRLRKIARFLRIQ
jgi:serine/threonine protein kinase